jgi:hypothetical protein
MQTGAKLLKAAATETSAGNFRAIVMTGVGAAALGAAAQISTTESEIQAASLRQERDLACKERMQEAQLASAERRHIRELEHAVRIAELSSASTPAPAPDVSTNIPAAPDVSTNIPAAPDVPPLSTDNETSGNL